MARRAALSVSFLTILSGGCGQTSVGIPDVPSLQGVSDVFEHPTGTVPVEQVSAELAQAQERLDALEQSRLADLLADGLAALRQRLEANKLSIIPDAPRTKRQASVDGFLRIHRICKGWDDSKTVPDTADGSLDLLAVVEDRVLERSLLVTATTCKGRIPVVNALALHPYVDGSILLYLEGPLPATAQETKLVGRLNGTIGNQTRSRMLSFAFRVIYPKLEVTIPAGGGEIVATRNPNGFELRGTNGTFTCSIETGTCE